jgi:PBSX family phage terminase large subunit
LIDIREIEINACYLAARENTLRHKIIFGGSSGGKSYAGHQMLLMQFLSIPGFNLLAMRKIADSIKVSVFSLFWQLLNEWGIGQNIVKINHTDHTFENLRNGNMILTGGMNDSKQREKVKSTTAKNGPISAIMMEEAPEFTVEDYRQLNIRLRGKLNPEGVSMGLYKQLWMFLNPVNVDHWIKSEFKIEIDSDGRAYSERDDVFVLKTTVDDNYFATDEDIAALDKLETVDPYMFEVYRKGNWGIVDAHNIIIPHSLIWKARKNQVEAVGQYDIGLDPAWFGNDDAAIRMKHGLKKIASKEYPKSDGPMLADEVQKLIRDHRKDLKIRVNVKIDITGTGTGAYDVLAKRKRESDDVEFWKEVYLYPVSFGGKAIEEDRFFNVAAEMYFNFRDLVPLLDWGFDTPGMNKEIGELTQRQYTIEEGKSRYKIEEKAKFKKRVGGSPDRADASVLCCYQPKEPHRSHFGFA